MRLPPPPHIHRKCYQAPAPSTLPASPSSSLGASNLSGREAGRAISHTQGARAPPRRNSPVLSGLT